MKTGLLAAPVPAAAAAACRQRAALLGDWRGSARLTGIPTGAAGLSPTFAC